MFLSSPGVSSRNRFYVLLGPDYTGKSTLLQRIKHHPEWLPISYDDGMLDEDFEILNTLKRDFFRSLAKGCHYSIEFLLAGFQMPVMYLRDRALAGLREENVLVDSYYYKILAKCLLKKIIKPAILDLWRASPAPDRILLLQGDLELQWRRAEQCGRLNPFEYYGDRPTRAGFIAFQRDLSQLLVEEAGAVPVDRIGGKSLDEAHAQLLEHLQRPRRPVLSSCRRALPSSRPAVVPSRHPHRAPA